MREEGSLIKKYIVHKQSHFGTVLLKFEITKEIILLTLLVFGNTAVGNKNVIFVWQVRNLYGGNSRAICKGNCFSSNSQFWIVVAKSQHLDQFRSALHYNRFKRVSFKQKNH